MGGCGREGGRKLGCPMVPSPFPPAFAFQKHGLQPTRERRRSATGDGTSPARQGIPSAEAYPAKLMPSSPFPHEFAFQNNDSQPIPDRRRSAAGAVTFPPGF